MDAGVAAIAALTAALVVFAALRIVRRRSRAAVEAEIEALRDEIWELRAAAAAKDKAEAASLAKSRFLATVSHAIRTPLNGILGLAQLLAMTRLEAEQASYVESIGDCARSLAALIDDILDFSKIEAGKLELRTESFALAPLVEGVVELLAPRAQGKALEIASFIASNAPARITGDPARLRQVLINLVGNAVNFTSNGGVGVSVAAQSGQLRFAIEDTGEGVEPAAREAIFEEFEQGDATATRRRGGTGLGLAISRRLVRRMGGELTLKATSPQGSTFAFTLPAPSGAAPAQNKPLLGRWALIVARTKFEAPFLAQYLDAAGAKALIARDEAEGLARLADEGTRPFDAVVVDCGLGEASTASLAAAARKAGAARLFLLFSPFERRAFGEAALQNFDGWLVKPVRAASLIARLACAAPKESFAPASAPAPILAGKLILLAEDNEINALIATRQLEALGGRATRAEDGARVVAIAGAAITGETAPFDVIM